MDDGRQGVQVDPVHIHRRGPGVVAHRVVHWIDGQQSIEIDRVASERTPSDKATVVEPWPSVTVWLPQALVECVVVPTTTFGDTGMFTSHLLVAVPDDALLAMVPPSVPVRSPDGAAVAGVAALPAPATAGGESEDHHGQGHGPTGLERRAVHETAEKNFGNQETYRCVGTKPGMPGNSAPACLDICSCIWPNILRDCSR